MIIGDFNINSVNAKQLTFDIQSMDITNNSSWGENISPFFVNKIKKCIKKLILKNEVLKTKKRCLAI